ncbi:MAG: sugar transferase, partial [Clostridia bacterium]|nr:sugar transferase [Clostridia bacterium]
MLRQNTKIVSAVKVFLDLFCVILAFFAAWYFRFVVHLEPQTDHLPLKEYIELLIISAPIFLILFVSFGLYRPQRIRSGFQEIYKLFLCGLLLFGAITVYLFVFKIHHISRILVGLFCAGTFLFCSACRITQRIIMRTLRKKGYNIKYILMLGLTPQGQNYLDSILRRKTLGYTPLGFMDSTPKIYKNIPYLGNYENLNRYLENNTVDEVVFALPLDQYSKLPEFIEICEKNGVKSVIIPTYAQFLPAKPQIDEIDDIPLVNTRYLPLDNLFFAYIKRFADIIISAALLVLLSPLFVLLWILIKCSSKGPAIYTQERVGYNKKPFKIYKFRTMLHGEHGTWTVENDPRVTKIGKFLRKSSMDELPQLYNV